MWMWTGTPSGVCVHTTLQQTDLEMIDIDITVELDKAVYHHDRINFRH